jgi:hypothetical protein
VVTLTLASAEKAVIYTHKYLGRSKGEAVKLHDISLREMHVQIRELTKDC